MRGPERRAERRGTWVFVLTGYCVGASALLWLVGVVVPGETSTVGQGQHQRQVPLRLEPIQDRAEQIGRQESTDPCGRTSGQRWRVTPNGALVPVEGSEPEPTGTRRYYQTPSGKPVACPDVQTTAPN